MVTFFGNPIKWSVAERCALVLGIFAAFTLWSLAAGLHFARHPEQAPYLDHTVLAIEIRLLAIQGAFALALMGWALVTRRRPRGDHPPVLWATVLLTAIVLIHGAYIYGTQTRMYTAAALCGCVTIGALLFDRVTIRRWLCLVIVGLGGVTVAEVTGFLPYAPLLRHLPMRADYLEPSWMLGGGGISLAILIVVVALTYRLVWSWKEQESRLVDAAERLVVAERLKEIINGIDDGIVVLDAERRLVSANEAFLRRAGRVAETAVGQPCDSVNPALECASQCPTRWCLATGERRTQVYARSLPGGGTAWEEVRASPIADTSGRIVRIVEVWRDISERRAAEERMAESHRLASLGMLASGFSHELNTPLATALACMESIARVAEAAGGDGPAWKRVAKSAATAREQLLRCRLTMQHFLRLSSDKGVSAEVVDVGAAVAAVAALSAPTAKAHDVAIWTDASAGTVRVRGNSTDLEHILLNLILNAIQASVPGGEIRLAVMAHDPIRIRVSDDGCGIAPADQKRIFEPFCTLRPAGTGLGLFVSLSFARRWGADIRVRSVPGAGSTFELVWPAIVPPETVMPASAPEWQI